MLKSKQLVGTLTIALIKLAFSYLKEHPEVLQNAWERSKSQTSPPEVKIEYVDGPRSGYLIEIEEPGSETDYGPVFKLSALVAFIMFGLGYILANILARRGN